MRPLDELVLEPGVEAVVLRRSGEAWELEARVHGQLVVLVVVRLRDLGAACAMLEARARRGA